MEEIYEITQENFNESFNLKHLLKNSAFYPASGIDATPLVELSKTGIQSFIHIDYSEKKENVERALRNNFTGVGYKLVGIKEVSKDHLTPNGFESMAKIPFNKHENDRIQGNDVIRDKLSHKNFTPFALWAVYELDPMAIGDVRGKMDKFSILHLGGEACATFDALYLSNGINPTAVVLLNPAEGYGDNWTLFTNPDFRLYQMLKMNVDQNAQAMPKYLLTNGNQTKSDSACWPLYVSDYTSHNSNSVLNEANKLELRYRWIELFSFENMIVEFIPKNERIRQIDTLNQISNAIFGNDTETAFSEYYIPNAGRLPNPKPRNFTQFLVNGPNYLWAIKVDNTAVGFVLIADMPHANSIGFSINSKYANKGIMTRAWAEISTHPDIIYPLYANTSQRNVAANQLLERCGFGIEGEFEFAGEPSFKYVKYR